MIMIRRGYLVWGGYFLYVRINRPRRFRNRRLGGGELVQLRGGAGHGSLSRSSLLAARLLCCYRPPFSRRGSTNRTLNIGMVQMFGGLLFFF